MFNAADVSFSRTENKPRADTTDSGSIIPGKSYLNFVVRDYAATAALNVWVYDTTDRPRADTTRDVVRDRDRDGLQDAWEVEQVRKYQEHYVCNAFQNVPILSVFGSGSPLGANENNDPDGSTASVDGDGGRNLGKHKAAGDSLTPFQEYRGFVLDGGGFDGNGANGHASGHKRLSPVYKEYLWEVDVMDQLPHTPEGGITTVLEATARAYSNKDRGPGIRVYWAISENQTPYQVFADPRTAPDARHDYGRAHRDPVMREEFIHVMFVADQAGSVPPGLSGGPSGVVMLYMKKLWQLANAENVDFRKMVQFVVAHETTHTLLNEMGRNGFSDGEHLTASWAEADLMHMGGSTSKYTDGPLWLPASICYLDLTSKEGVER